jgi:hypothetical protein
MASNFRMKRNKCQNCCGKRLTGNEQCKESIVLQLKEQIIKDDHGNPIGVFLNIDEYRKLLAELEELEEIRAYDLAKNADDEAIPFEQTISEIESLRK